MGFRSCYFVSTLLKMTMLHHISVGGGVPRRAKKNSVAVGYIDDVQMVSIYPSIQILSGT